MCLSAVYVSERDVMSKETIQVQNSYMYSPPFYNIFPAVCN